MMSIKKAAFIAGILVLVLTCSLVFLTIYIPTSFYLLALSGYLPAFVIAGCVYYAATKIFIPNPKIGSIKNVLAMECVEHLVIPILLIFCLLTQPLLFYPLLLLSITVIFGFVLGKIANFTDVVKLSVLCLLLFIGLWIPELLLYGAHMYEFSFNLAGAGVCMVSLCAVAAHGKIINRSALLNNGGLK